MNVCWIVVILIFLLSKQNLSFGSITKRQASTCQLGEQVCSDSRPCIRETATTIITCTCGVYGVSCDSKPKVRRVRCYDRRRRIYHPEGARWERRVGGRTLDCTCKKNRHRRPIVSCSGENRCHNKGVSYVTGSQWRTSDVTGMVLNCTCHGNERVTCRGTVTRETPRPENDAQLVESHVVYGKEILRPRIATLQACDTGDRVVSSGYTWNQTTAVNNREYTVEQCECRDALIHCHPYRFSRVEEPHCLTNKGEVKRVGESWIKVHHSHSNIRWKCRCKSNGKKSCKDIGYCKDPNPPPNGAMVCVTKGEAGPKQTMFCKSLCLQGYDFFNRQRYYRIWEVCGQVTRHRWSGGYLEDALLLAKCRRPEYLPHGRSSLYLPSDSCENLTKLQINQIKNEFHRSLIHEHLCPDPRKSTPAVERCTTKWFKCGSKIQY